MCCLPLPVAPPPSSYPRLRLPPGHALPPGVYRHRRRYGARVRRRCRVVHLGYHATPEQAAAARRAWLERHPPRRPRRVADEVLAVLAAFHPDRLTGPEVALLLPDRYARYVERTLTDLHAAGRVVQDYDGRGYGLAGG